MIRQVGNIIHSDPTVVSICYLRSGTYTYLNIYKGKGKLHPRTSHEGPEGEYRYGSTLSLTSALEGVGGQRNSPAALPPGKRPGTHCKMFCMFVCVCVYIYIYIYIYILTAHCSVVIHTDIPSRSFAWKLFRWRQMGR